MKMRLRTKFLLASLLISAGLTGASLLLVRRAIQSQARKQIQDDLHHSVLTFQNVQRQRENSRIHSAQLVADLPIIRALMTTEDERTIQEASAHISGLAGNELFVLADPAGKLMALHISPPGFERAAASRELLRSLQAEARTHWWFGGGRLYEVSVQPIYFGPNADERLLGFVAIGSEVDDELVRELSQVSASEVAFFYGTALVRSTLPERQRGDLLRHYSGAATAPGRTEIGLAGEHFLVDTVELNAGPAGPVRLAVLKSLDEATRFLRDLNRLLMATGIIALTSGAILVFFISHTFTRPLHNLVAGVRALGQGDYTYPLETRGSDEVAEVAAAFNRMRTDLQQTQRELLDSERLATIGRMASSISHDLRHHLVAVMANAEYLVDPRRGASEREELHQEVQSAVREMNDLIESLLEFSRTRASLRLGKCNIEEVVAHAMQTAHMHPQFHNVPVTLEVSGACEGAFDAKKLERVFQNLLLNACAAVAPSGGGIYINIGNVNGAIEVRVTDQGPGVPAEIRGKIFEPFFSFGKENGTGLGLTVAQKIVQDHGGDLSLESSSEAGSVFLVTLPLVVPASAVVAHGDRS